MPTLPKAPPKAQKASATGRLVLALFLGLALPPVSTVLAENLYWKANLGTTNWNNGFGSWAPGSGGGWWWNPSGGNTLYFEDIGGSSQTLNNNTGDWQSFSLIFSASAGTYTINGNAFNIVSKIENNSTATQTINTSLSANNGAREINPVNGDLKLNGSNFYLGTGGGGELRVWGNNGKTLTLNTVVGETGNLSVQERTTVLLQKTNTYSGETFVHAGELQIQNNGRVGIGKINLGGTNLSGVSSATNALYLGAANSSGGINNTNQIDIYSAGGTTILGSRNTSGVNTNSGNVTLNRGVTLDTVTGGSLNFSGVMSGSGSMTKTGGGTLILSGGSQNSFSGAATVNAGTLRLEKSGGNAVTGSSIAVNSGGTLLLGAANQIGDSTAVTLSGGTLNTAGYADAVGKLTVSAGSTIQGLNSTSGSAFTFSDVDLGGYATSSGAALTLLPSSGTYGLGTTLQLSSVAASSWSNYNATSLNNFSSKISFGDASLRAQINFGGGTSGTTLTVAAIPEPKVYIAAAGLLSLIAFTEYRRRTLARRRA